ncbi:EamA/RhaT family transporter [Pusillimonas sp. ANT_WB101]|uniref:EamA/RhaT family transporter n=1 Tax=Pusillimonas sp. ANT_WB101 TaxID=2597356 RepID=UPI0011F05C68|nr:EamA/RhaT family transporter [Pusillimonas sp. ANT_WB101]KAA0890260.1 EamA/RhaT family transporter [Pusillimonas sp. ANT_WB101]
MHTLIISIACSVAVSILLKMARRQNIAIDQAIAVNYVVAAALCLIVLRPQPASLLSPSTPWWILALLGVLLPTIFLAMAGAVRHAGIVLSDAAQRLSLFIPLIAAFVIFSEDVSGTKLMGIAIALVALVCLLLRPRQSSGSGDTFKTTGLLLAVWVGYGTIDILFKQLAKSGAVFSSSLFAAFALAGILIFIYLTLRRTVWQRRNIVAGLVLGLLNFGNIYFYIRAHQVFPDNPTLVFSAMNIGVISLGTLVGAGFFRERLSWVNALGIVLAISAIVILIPR